MHPNKVQDLRSLKNMHPNKVQDLRSKGTQLVKHAYFFFTFP
jgi:hypothetical protein